MSAPATALVPGVYRAKRGERADEREAPAPTSAQAPSKPARFRTGLQPVVEVAAPAPAAPATPSADSDPAPPAPDSSSAASDPAPHAPDTSSADPDTAPLAPDTPSAASDPAPPPPGPALEAREHCLAKRERRLLRMQEQQKRSHAALRRRHAALVEAERALAERQDELAEERRVFEARKRALELEQRAFAETACDAHAVAQSELFSRDTSDSESRDSLSASTKNFYEEAQPGEPCRGILAVAELCCGDIGENAAQCPRAMPSGLCDTASRAVENQPPEDSKASTLTRTSAPNVQAPRPQQATDMLLHLQAPPLEQVLRGAMNHAGWNPGRAAASLGISRAALYDLLRQLGIRRSAKTRTD